MLSAASAFSLMLMTGRTSGDKGLAAEATSPCVASQSAEASTGTMSCPNFTFLRLGGVGLEEFPRLPIPCDAPGFEFPVDAPPAAALALSDAAGCVIAMRGSQDYTTLWCA